MNILVGIILIAVCLIFFIFSYRLNKKNDTTKTKKLNCKNCNYNCGDCKL